MLLEAWMPPQPVASSARIGTTAKLFQFNLTEAQYKLTYGSRNF